MFDVRHEGGRAHIRADGLTFGAWLERLQTDSASWTRMLASLPHPATHFELPPLRDSTLDRPFEAVCVSNERLAQVAPEPHTFEEHFGAEWVASFTNLGGDSTLIAPRPPGDYAHLLAFLRTAPAQACEALWACVAQEVTWSLDEEALWVSTAGMGVYWLHVRLDRRPKYYRYQPYRMDGA